MTVLAGESHAVSTALDTAFRQVIETMFGLEVEGPFAEDAVPAGGAVPALTLAGMVGLAGHEFRGMLQVACDEEGARKLAATLLGGEEMLGDDPAIVRDSLGELANMIGGSLKRQLDHSGSAIELSLPSVLEGEARIRSVGATDGVWLGWRAMGSTIVTSLVYAETTSA